MFKVGDRVKLINWPNEAFGFGIIERIDEYSLHPWQRATIRWSKIVLNSNITIEDLRNLIKLQEPAILLKEIL